MSADAPDNPPVTVWLEGPWPLQPSRVKRRTYSLVVEDDAGVRRYWVRRTFPVGIDAGECFGDLDAALAYLKQFVEGL